MTHFLDKHVGEDEKFIAQARLHWIYILSGVVWLAALSAFGYWLDQMLWINFGAKAPLYRQEIFGLSFGSQYPWTFWMLAFLGGIVLIIHILKVFASEVALTDQRVLYKKGFIFVDVKEIDLQEIRAEQIRHGLLGRFLGYGMVHMDSRFVGDVYLPALKKPYKFLHEIHKARRELHDAFDE